MNGPPGEGIGPGAAALGRLVRGLVDAGLMSPPGRRLLAQRRLGGRALVTPDLS